MSIFIKAFYYFLKTDDFNYHLGVIPIKNSKLILGMGRESTDKYSSLNKLLMAPFNDKSAHLVVTPLSRVRLLMK